MTQPSANSGDTFQDDTNRDHGCLPDWQTGDLPEPLPFTPRNIFRTIGPGAILLAGSIGGGEWIAGPMVAVNYGPSILWIATVSIFLQMTFNLEAIRYTLYSGEPIVTGIMRLSPGSKFWAVFYIVMGVIQLATPAMALGCANVLFAAVANREPVAADATTLLWVAYVVLAIAVVMLLSGKSIERVLERLSWAMVTFIFSFLIVANVLFVPLAVWKETSTGFLTPHALPANVDIMLLAAIATDGIQPSLRPIAAGVYDTWDRRAVVWRERIVAVQNPGSLRRTDPDRGSISNPAD